MYHHSTSVVCVCHTHIFCPERFSIYCAFKDALEPYMSKRTLEVHWGKHHREYVEGLNKQLANSPVLYGYTLEELIRATYNNGNPLPEFNNAAQVILVSFPYFNDAWLLICSHGIIKGRNY